MSTRQASRRAQARTRQSLFARVLVGVDGTKESLDACRQVCRLAEPTGTIEAALVSQFPPAAAKALGVEDLAERLERAASSALSAAARILGPQAELRRLEGITVEALLAEATRIRATLLAIGTTDHARLQEIVFGGVAGELLHQAPCAVLIARPAPDMRAFPREIVVGLDGSAEAERAFDIALNLAARRHSSLRSVVALGGKHVNVAGVVRRHRHVEDLAAAPVPALIEAASCADLLVVGSRGLHGIKALGSVSERAAHHARCSVLVIR